MTNEPEIKLTEFQFFILVALAQVGKDGLHGYGILQSIEEITKGLRKFALPSLYEALNTLVANGLAKLDRTEEEKGRLRKYFCITGAGGRAMSRHHEESELIRGSVRRIPEVRQANG